MTEWALDYGLYGLFLSAFVSSTLAPGGSEAVLAYLAGIGGFDATSLVLVATVGNTLGALTTWGLGRLLRRHHDPERGLSPNHARAIAQVRRWGWLALLFSWLPLIGDGFCFAAGWLRLPFWTSFLAITVGKIIRYTVFLWAWYVAAQAY